MIEVIEFPGTVTITASEITCSNFVLGTMGLREAQVTMVAWAQKRLAEELIRLMVPAEEPLHGQRFTPFKPPAQE